MKHINSSLLILASSLLLASCGISGSTSSTSVSSGTTTSESSSSSVTSSATTSDSVSSESTEESEVSESESSSNESSSSAASQTYDDGNFAISTGDGSFEVSSGVITILSGGVYSLSGAYSGMIYGDLTDEDEVELDFNGVSLSNSSNSCIYFLNADKLKLKMEEGSTNSITDARPLETVEDETQGGGAIYAKCDTNFVGKGSLEVTGTYNNGVHVTKDLKIKNVTLTASAPNTAIKGNDSVTIESGKITAISSNGDGIKSSDSDISSNGNQRGDIDITGGTITVYSCYDAISAAYDANISGGTLNLYTNAYRPSNYLSGSSNLATPNNSITLDGGPGGGGPGGGGPGGGGGSSKSDESAKGIKANNSVNISGGTIDISAYDDGIHANNDNTLENGESPLGDVNISGGYITVKASDDGVHADGTLSISDGEVQVTQAYEGLEGNVIEISGGKAVAYASDDGINAGSGSKTPYVRVSGGYLFVAVPSSGDTDGLDTNGYYEQTGGTVITAGPNQWMASAFDIERGASISGGTLACFGTLEKDPSKSSNITKSTKSGSYGGKAYTITFANGSIVTETLKYSGYSNLTTYSELGSLQSIS